MAVQLSRHRFTVDDYYRMARAGVLGEDDRVELIDGEVVDMPPIGPGHSSSVARIGKTFERALGDVALVWTQNPLRLDRYTEPEPDVALVRTRSDFYRSAHPGPDDILLVVEVADTTLAADRSIKMPLYARHGVPEAWLVDVRGDVIHVYRDPAADGYRVVSTYRRGDRLAPLAFADCVFEVSDLLG